MTVTADGWRQTPAARPQSRAVAAKRLVLPARREIPKIVRWSLIAFSATLPFEAADLGFASSSFSLAKLAGLGFLGAYFFHYNPVSGKRRCPPISAPLWCFLVYLGVYLANGFFLNHVYFGQFVSIFLTLAQLALLFWICSSLFRNESLARGVLIAYALAAVASSLGTLLHVPGFSTVIDTRMGARVTSLEFNPNFLAYSLALAAIILAGFALDMSGRWSGKKIFLMCLILPPLAMIVRTGSRAGLAAFAIGFAICALFSRQSHRKFALVALCIFVGAALAYLMIQNQTALARIQQAYSGNLASRWEILSASLGMALERPLLGWQPVAQWTELGRRVGLIWGVKDAHNLVFHLLLEAGLVGAVPFLIGLYLCARNAWRARSGRLGILPFALILAALSANLTHTYLTRKPQWLVLALGVAAGTAGQRKPGFYVIRRPVNSPQ
ncbi:MAG: O-antigen ligase family protein [Candidatus Binatia bacterium]